MFKNEDDFKKLIDQLNIDDKPGDAHRENLRCRMLSVFNDANRKTPHSLKSWQTIGRTIMKNPITKLAAAAVIIIAVIIGIQQFGGSIDGANVAWASLAERVEQIQTCIFQGRINITGGPKGDITQEVEMYVSSEYGFRADSYMDGKLTMMQYALAADKVLISVMPSQKKYIRMLLTDEHLRKMRQQGYGDPREWVREFTSLDYTELGRDIIDGIEVEGIETNDPRYSGGMFESFTGRLWVDVETDLPVRMEMEAQWEAGAYGGPTQMSMVMNGFEWDVELEPSIFEPNLPADYTLMAEVQMPGLDEASAVQGLRIFSEIVDGKYPTTMNPMKVMREVAEAAQASFYKESIERDPNSKPSQKERDEMMKKVMEKTASVHGAYMFYAELVKEEKDPAYYGDKVTTEFADAVLMRWKISDDLYRVVFGDLTIESVSAERLAELESMPLNTRLIAIKPQPAEGAVGSPVVGLELGWMPGMDSVGHRVYFGTDAEKLSLLGEVTDANYTELPTLERDTTYYWCVDEVQADGSIVAGDVWSFNTGKLVGWWKLDETSGNIAGDSSGNGNEGTLNGDPIWVAGQVDGALEFDGDGDYVDIGNDSNFDITDAITVMAWIKVGTFDKDWQSIVTKGEFSWRLARNKNTNAVKFNCGSWPIWQGVAGSKSVNDGLWHHIVGVNDGTKLYLYIDGVLDNSTNALGTPPIQTSDAPIHIGSNPDRSGRQWNGLIDEVRIYNYALSEAEIAELYESMLATEETATAEE